MSDSLTVAENQVVTIHYTLKDDDGEILDSSVGHDPMEYLHGVGQLVEGLEKALIGSSVGDKKHVVVSPEEGYGPRDADSPPQPIPRTQFPPGATIEPGMMFQAQDENGQAFAFWVVGMDEEVVLIDVNHPLAGVTLNFDVEIIAVRAATEEEQAHGHAHGPDGHHEH